MFLPAKSLALPFIAVAFADNCGLPGAGGWFAVKENVFLFNAEEATVVRKFFARFTAHGAMVCRMNIIPGIIAFAQDEVMI